MVQRFIQYFHSRSSFPAPCKFSNTRFRVAGWAALALIAHGMAGRIQAQSVSATTTSLVISSGATPTSSVNAGAVVTLTANVTAGTVLVTPGLVKFCDAAAAYCEDNHSVGTAQLTNSGVATVRFRPGIGTHSYKAVFVGTNIYAGSNSTPAPLAVTGLYPTSTTFTETGGLGSYNVTATVTGAGLYATSPSGSVSFVDTSNSNAVFGQSTLSAGTSTLRLVNPAWPAISKTPSAIATGDFNGDGIPDLAITSTATSTVVIWLGNGDGTFKAAGTSATGTNPNAIAVADFNSDGIPDLAITNFNCGLGCTGSVTILLGNGDGTFTPATTTPGAGSGPSSIVAGDFNGDGIPDLAVANSDGDSITVLLGKGDGTFTAAPVITLPANTIPPFIFSADFNGDGKLDLATFSEGTNEVIVLVGNGDGTFPTKITSSTKPDLEPFTSGGNSAMYDLNEDGFPDLVLTSSQSRPVVLLGTGSGTFTVGVTLGEDLVSIVAGNFYGNGVPAIAGNSGYEIYYFEGAGDGTFSSGPAFNAGQVVDDNEFDFEAFVSADLNGDGISDLAGPGFDALTDAGHLFPLLSSPGSESTGTTSIRVGAGSHLVEASYSGDSNDGSSVSATTTLVGPDNTTLNLAASSSPHVYGQPLVLTATLNPYSSSGYGTDGEAISFYNGGALIGTDNLSSGVATLTLGSLAAGSYSFNANYSGDGRFLTSTSGSIPATILQATPPISWAPPAAVSYGTALSAAQLNATSSVAGIFSYSPSAGTILAAGVQTLSVAFTPADATDYATANAQVTLTVNQVTPTINWSTPAAIIYGTALSAAQLNATASVPGTFAYSPSAGTVLTAGSHPISVTFNPTDSTDYKGSSATVFVIVNQATPTITWANPPPGTYGTPLSAAQLDATASVPGSFYYSTGAGSIVSAGSHLITATFYPTDSTDYSSTSASTTFVVNRATPTVTWAEPAAISYGAALGSAQLDAAATGSGAYSTTILSGSFAYAPGAGTVLAVGSHALSATFTPSDTSDYTTATASVTLAVNPATPTITWGAPAAITYGTALSGTQLDASSAVAGSFVYSPAAGAILTAGQQTLKATFTPKDAIDYAPTTASIVLTVNPATPTIAWATPAPIAYGTALSATQLNASTSVAGAFAYSPAAGSVLKAGPQTLTATFTPTDGTDYNVATATVTLTVNPVAPTISWTAPAPITYGAALGTAQLDATASIPGTFVYSPAAGTVLSAGQQKLSVTFTPTDQSDFSGGTASVPLTVDQATPTITWATPDAIAYGTALSAVQLNATSNIAGTFAYNPPAGTIPVIGNDTLSVIFTPTDSTDYTTASGSVILMVVQPPPAVTSLSPAIESAGGAKFNVTVNGAGFTAGSMVHWGSTALTTQYVSSTQLTAEVPAANIATAGVETITVQNPAPGGGTSNSFQFEVDTAGGETPPDFTTDTATVAPGSSASYPVTLPSKAADISATCLNLPAGAVCTYSEATGAVSIATSSTTPAGMYQITVVFTETLPGLATALVFFPTLLLPFRSRKKRTWHRWLNIAIVGIVLTVVVIGCGGGSTSSTSNHQVTSSGTVSLTVQ